MNITHVKDSLALLERLFDPRHATEPFIPATVGKPMWEHIGAKAGPFFDAAALEGAGISPAALKAFLVALQQNPNLYTHGVVIAKDGKLLLRAHLGAHDVTLPRYMYSASKTVTAMAVGVLFDRGILSFEEKLIDLFPSYFNPVSRLRFSSLTVEDLLTMRSAVTFGEADAMTDDDWVGCFLSASLSGEIGKSFAYNSLNTYMLSVIVEKKTGMTLDAFVKKTFFAPLGIENTFWESCPKGHTIGGWGLYITPMDLCKMASILIDGTYGGQRYLSEEFVTKMRTPIVQVSRESGAYDYSYHMWVNVKSGVALMNGMFGQNVFLDAKTGITLAVLSGNSEVFQKSETYAITEAFLSTVGEGGTWTSDENEAIASLLSALCEQAHALPEPPKKRGFFASMLLRWLAPREETAPTETKNDPFSMHTFSAKDDMGGALGLLPLILQAVRNHYTRGFVCLTVGKEKDGALSITWKEKDTAYTFLVGMDGMSRRTWLTFAETPYLVDAKGTLAENEDGDPVLRMELFFAETPHTRTVKLFAHKNGTYTLLVTEEPGEALIAREATAAKHRVEDTPIIGSFLSKIDDDYLAYSVKRAFSPQIGVERD